MEMMFSYPAGVKLNHRSRRSRYRGEVARASTHPAASDGTPGEARYAGDLLTAPLSAILEQGKRDGTFPSAQADTDARMITAITLDAAGLNAAGVRQTRPEARRAVLDFCRRALGA